MKGGPGKAQTKFALVFFKNLTKILFSHAIISKFKILQALYSVCCALHPMEKFR
jgi:hypothetical protein